MLLTLLFFACGPEPVAKTPVCTITFPEVVDECSATCGVLSGPLGTYALRSDLDGRLQYKRVPGPVEYCLPERVSPGIHTISAVSVDAGVECSTTVDVRPFGYALGLERDTEPLTELPWVPEVQGIDAPPIVVPAPEGWNADAVNHPSFIRYQDQDLLYFAGGTEENGEEAYEIGVAIRDESGRFIPYEGNPLLGPTVTGAEPGDWNYDHQNTPEPVLHGEDLWLYYNGYDQVAVTLAIGVVGSSDGMNFESLTDVPAIPGGVSRAFVDGARAHPSLVVRDGLYEMWFASGTLEIGYALSTDGLNFQEYCGGPVFGGAGEETWDENEVKAPDVVWDGEYYYMMYSGCDKTCRQIGWAMSRDGLNWLPHDEPVLPPGPRQAWNGETTQGGSLFVEGDRWHIYYAASKDGVIQVGYAYADRP